MRRAATEQQKKASVKVEKAKKISAKMIRSAKAGIRKMQEKRGKEVKAKSAALGATKDTTHADKAQKKTSEKEKKLVAKAARDKERMKELEHKVSSLSKGTKLPNGSAKERELKA